jgi:hypothetical protein
VLRPRLQSISIGVEAALAKALLVAVEAGSCQLPAENATELEGRRLERFAGKKVHRAARKR